MSQEIFNWIGISFDICLFLFAIFYLIIKFFINKYKQKKVSHILTLNDFPEIINNKKTLDKSIKKYFKGLFIREVSLNLFKKFLKSETGIGKKPTKIAWEFYVLLATSVLANKSQGKVSEAITSIKRIFHESKKLLLDSDNGSLLTDIIFKIMNFKIRPILTNSRFLPQKNVDNIFIVDDDKLNENEINNFWKQIDKVRKEIIEDKFLYFVSILSLSGQTNNDIKNLLNYSSNIKSTYEEIN